MAIFNRKNNTFSKKVTIDFYTIFRELKNEVINH